MSAKGTDSNKQHTEQTSSVRPYLRKTWWVIKGILLLLFISILFGGGIAGGYFASHIQDEPQRSDGQLQEELHTMSKTGEAFFRDGESIGELRSNNRLYPVELNEVNETMIDALLATEDNEFFEHEGVNVRGLTRAVQEELASPGEGSGGSTITQQLVKNQIVGPERTLERKSREMALAIRVEKSFTKEEILQTYLNVIYFGFNANGTNTNGIQAASTGIFGVDASELNLAQSAYLAGMIHAPGQYTPFDRNGAVLEENIEQGQARAQWVLKRMMETERITEAEYRAAQEYDYEEDLAERSPRMVEEYPYLTFTIEDRAAEIIAEQIMAEEGTERDDYEEGELQSIAKDELAQGGYQVYTTIDQDLYDAFHEVAEDYEFGPRSSTTFTYEDPDTGEEEERGYLEQAAATLIDNETGAVLAMLEGRDFDESQIDFTTRPFQPGSAIKPVLDYGPALEEGLLQPATPIDDVPLFDYGDTPPTNFNGDFLGLLSVRDALKISQNIPAIKTLRQTRAEIGEDGLYEYAQQLGLSHIQEEDMGYDATAIGGLSGGWTVEDGTAAYATFANQGQHYAPYMIERIETAQGEIVYEHDLEPEQVFSEETAFLMNDMLREVVDGDSGTAQHTVGRRLGHTGIDLAGKTGTTNDRQDYWFIGYTPQISLGLWMGYQHRDSLADQYSVRHQNLWVELFEAVGEHQPDTVHSEAAFEEPDRIEQVTVCSKSGKLPSELCEEEDYLTTDYFHPDHVPTETDDVVVEERVVIVDGARYIALDDTPDEFVEEGDVFIRREPLDIPEEYEDERSRWLPEDWDDTALTDEDPRQDNGQTPSFPTGVNTDGSSIIWDAVDEEDIAGYRIYGGNGDQVGSVPAHEETSYSDSEYEEYYVTAVDIKGRESAPSDETDAPDASSENGQTEDNDDENGKAGNHGEAPADAPDAPSGVEASGSLEGVTVTWDAHAEEEEVDRYNIYVSTSDGFIQTGHTSSSTSYEYFPNGTKNNEFYVTAVNEAGESDSSATVSIDLEE